MSSLSLPKLSLKGAVNKLENAIITVSGPAIAISGIIAGIDLLTGGSMFKDVRWLSLTWAICLLLTLDFQVLMLGARARRIYGSEKHGGRKIAEIVMIILIAGAISSVSVQMQSIIARSQATIVYTDRTGQHVRNLTIDEATQQMHIDPVALIWERSALVLVLIFMSGWFRDEEHQDSTAQPAQAVSTTAQPQLSSAQPVLNTEDLAKQIRKVLHSELAAIAQSRHSSANVDVQDFVQNSTEVKEIKQSKQQAVIAQHSTAHDEHEDSDEAVHITQQATIPTLRIVHPEQGDEQDEQGSAREKVLAYLSKHPEHLEDNKAVMDGAKVNVYAARRYRGEYKKMRGAQ